MLDDGTRAGVVRFFESSSPFLPDRFSIACTACPYVSPAHQVREQAERLWREHKCLPVKPVDPKTVLKSCEDHLEFVKGCSNCWAADMFGQGKADVDGR